MHSISVVILLFSFYQTEQLLVDTCVFSFEPKRIPIAGLIRSQVLFVQWRQMEKVCTMEFWVNMSVCFYQYHDPTQNPQNKFTEMGILQLYTVGIFVKCIIIYDK